MQYFLILLLSILSTVKISFQSAFSKNSVKNKADILVFNFLVFLFSGILFSVGIVNSSPAVYGYAFFGALFTVLFQLTYTEALSMGNVSLTVLIVNLGMVLNVIFSYFVYKEPMSWIRFIGVALTLVTFVICTDFKKGKPTEKKWYIYTICAMFATTLASMVQQIFSKSQYSEQNGVYVAAVYIIGAIFLLLAYMLLKKKGVDKTFKIDKRVILLTMATGICLGLYKFVSTYSLTVVEGTFFYPARAGIGTIFSAISGVLIFKDKLNAKQKLSVIIGIIAIIFIKF